MVKKVEEREKGRGGAEGVGEGGEKPVQGEKKHDRENPVERREEGPLALTLPLKGMLPF